MFVPDVYKMPFPIETKINGQILREHLTLFPKANHHSVEELILHRKFSSKQTIEKTLEKHGVCYYKLLDVLLKNLLK